MTEQAPDRETLIAGVKQWQETGFGIDPNQVALRHYPGDKDCQCFQCADTPIITTKAPYNPTGERTWSWPSNRR